MYFVDEGHENNFYELLEVYSSKSRDMQYLSTIYVATHPDIYGLLGEVDTEMSPLFNLATWDDGKEKFVFTAGGLTGATTRMCEFALSLYNGYLVSLDDVFGSVTEPELVEVLLQAIKIRRGIVD